MSKIEDALRKAKEQRSGRAAEAPPEAPAAETTPSYSRTAFRPVDPTLMEENRIVMLSKSDAAAVEQFRMLRTQILQKTEGNGDNCLMVTSALDGEGKTTTAINLAVSIAKEIHKTVLLVDADLRRPTAHRLLGLEPEQGLSHYLLEDVPLEKLLVRTGVEKLSFLPGGEPMEESTEILRSAKMQDLIREVKARYRNRYVIFDTTPLLSTADAKVLAPFMDGIVLVVRAERTPRSDLSEALRLLEGHKILGMVMNGFTGPVRRYGDET